MNTLKSRVSWSILTVIAVLLIIIGLQGSLGKMLGCILTPAEVAVNE